ncbi:uncharacterized protein LOC118456863 [Anopheles albimanus]|uniref:uncharacterized protein LOC118456863 n=1 Tax=Anopheles albimanus TaxID=7167 RepID=UPI00164215EB|nr:uncharacterized protein LOC118456863 [Anopheles albimanus]
MAYVRRFVHNAKRPPGRAAGPLTPNELKEAETLILRELQRETYPEAYIQANATDTEITARKGSPLHKRKPYMDLDGLIRMKGRIDECSFADPEMKRPVILPKNGTVVELIVDDYHRKFRHSNHETVVNELRLKYDIPALRRAVRNARNKCTYCALRSSMPENPQMAPIPAARLAAYERPFTFTGIDYFGPFTVTMGRNRTEKRWGVLFTCLTIRAIHIEIAASLSTSACIMALRSFIARRGTPNEIYSDRGTNFIGASKELVAAAKQVDRSALIAEANLPNTSWRFNPPAAPHFGGAWERMIGTVKRVLSKIEFDRQPTDAVLRNVLIEAEMMINMRPLTHVPLDRDDEAPLTPNHFLLGSSSGVKPLILPGEAPPDLKNTWKAAQQANNRIWERWIKTYLTTIRKPSK